VKRQLLAAVVIERTGLRNLVHACVSKIRNAVAWPELHEHLSSWIMSGTQHATACSLECVTALLDECDADVAVSLGILQDPMLRIARAEATPPTLRRQCARVHASAVNSVFFLESPGDRLVDDVVTKLPAWMGVYAALCAGADEWSNPERIACALSAIHTLASLSRLPQLSAALAAHMEAVLRPTCSLLQQLLPAYEGDVVNTDDEGASEEEEGVAQLIAQFMELLQAVLAMPKLRPLLKGNVRPCSSCWHLSFKSQRPRSMPGMQIQMNSCLMKMSTM